MGTEDTVGYWLVPKDFTNIKTIKRRFDPKKNHMASAVHCERRNIAFTTKGNRSREHAV